MSILQKNLINKNNSKNIFGEKNPNIFFNDKICSTNIPNHKKHPLVGALRNERRRLLKKEVDFDNEYEIKPIHYKKNEKQKISDILSQTIGYNNINYSMLWRLKFISNPEIQFFFLDDLSGNYEVLIIDIYHLIIPAADKDYHEKHANPKKKYFEHQNANYDLKHIFHSV